MPRPKRTKVAPSAPAPRVRKPAKAPPPVAAALDVPQETFNDLYDVSDIEEGPVTSMRPVKKNNGKGKAVAASSSRAFGAGMNSRDSEDEEGETLEKRLQAHRMHLENQEEESLLPDIDLESSSPAMEVGRREQNTPAVETSLLAIGNFRRRPRQPSILGRGPGRARSSSVESIMAEDNGLMSVGRKNTSALMSNLKQRPRERGIMGRNVAPVPPSSIALEMERDTPAHVGSAMKIGTFKRREREPSILRTAQKARQEQALNYEDDDEDDFNPEDESTPLNLSKTRNMTSSSAASSSNSRKRKLSAVQVPRSSPPPSFSGAIDADESIPATGSLSDEEEQDGPEPEPQPRLLPSIEARSDTPEPLSETMAPPQSSSPSPSSPELPSRIQRASSRGRRPLRGRTPPPRTQDSPISSPPSLTHSPNRPAHSAATTRKPQRQVLPPSTFSTAQLQALLPRRRRNTARDVFDIPSSEDEVDVSGLAPEDDELSHLNVQARSRRHTSIRSRTPAPLKRPKVNKPGLKQKDSSMKRTYGSRVNATSDKENDAEVDPDDSLAPIPDDEGRDISENSQEVEKRVGKELKRAAKKFKEVDQWELEFEEVTASSSSPNDAR